MNQQPPTTSPPRRGYVLLMVLLLLAVSAAIVGVLCRQATRSASAAAMAQASLQLRWGRVSCETAFLPAADNIMDRARLAGAPASSIVWENIVLGGQAMRLGFVDEQARLNLNAVYSTGGKDAVRQALQTLGQTGVTIPRLILGPAPDAAPASAFASLPFGMAPMDDTDDSNSDDAPPVMPVIGSFGQLFPDASAAELANVEVTCWGDGKINLNRASATVISQAAGLLLSPRQIQAIIAARNAQLDVPLQTLLSDAGAQDADRLAEKFTDESFCHSLWIVTQVGKRRAYRLAVRDATDSQHEHSAEFDW